MKVLCFIDCLGAGGAQRQLVGLAVMLQERGYEVKVCTYYSQDFYKPYLEENDVPNELIPGASDVKQRIWAVRQYFKKEQPDWVIAYQETPSLVASAARVLGCNYKLIVSERNTTQVVGMNERVRFFLYHWADAIVPNSYAQEKWLSEHHPWMRKKLTTIPNFVDHQQFTPNVGHQRQEVPYIMVAASIWQSKNTLNFIEALRILIERSIAVKVKWFGKSKSNIEYFNRCVALIEQYGLQDYIELLEKTEDIADEYRQADFFCLPSLYEGTPNVICEAMACGLPILCSDVCDNGIYVKNEDNGFLFNPHVPESIANAVEQAAIMTGGNYQRFCERSRVIAEETLSSNMFVESYLNIIEKK